METTKRDRKKCLAAYPLKGNQHSNPMESASTVFAAPAQHGKPELALLFFLIKAVIITVLFGTSIIKLLWLLLFNSCYQLLSKWFRFSFTADFQSFHFSF